MTHTQIWNIFILILFAGIFVLALAFTKRIVMTLWRGNRVDRRLVILAAVCLALCMLYIIWIAAGGRAFFRGETPGFP